MFSIQTTYTNARQNLAKLLDRVANDNTIALITRKGHPDMAIIRADELSSILETLHLLRSPANAQKLNQALERSLARDSEPVIASESIVDLCQELGIAREQK
ncbi:prevent-host-death family protein [Stanieria cyanosphaera PCC 7437]|uniref:Antitoxin n=1 Tax=Stanieria cyanosphaera (strain ATCC 29371 / PCC 7437) TaxID=111780 RepID=K9XSU4_STAC7|nr:type II toxin-antitoxin system Phd/YefM family antitoxin [Stanieria cyanosphaera]AFZ35675.1 prevent-host-death family protein [Stanieria cyanosphaera PCC 7437]